MPKKNRINQMTSEEILAEKVRELDFLKNTLDEHAIVSITDVRGNITYVNDKFCDISGYSREELLDRNHRILKSNEHSQEFYDDLWRTISSGKPWHGEIKNLKKLSGYYWVKATIVPFLNEQGKPFQYVAIRTDITEQKNTVEALALSEKHFHQLYNEAPVMIHSIDLDGNITDINDFWCETLGYDRAEIMGTSILQVLTDESKKYAIEVNMPRFYKDGFCRDVPYHLVKKNGEIIDILLSGLMLRNQAGENDQSIIVMVDVTAEKESLRLMQTEQQRLLDALESVTDGVSLYDKNDRLVLCNERLKEQLSDISDLLVPGTSYEDITYAIFEKNIGFLGQETSVEEAVRKQLDFHRNQNEVLARQEKDGRWIMLHEYKTKDGGTFVIRSDITDLKKAQNEAQIAKEVAEIADRTKSEFLANMSHELRTPLNAIIGFSDVIRTETLGPLGNKQYKEYIQDIHNSGQHLLKLINDILDVSVIEAGKIELRESEFHVDDTIEASLQLVKSRAERMGIELINSIDGDAPIIRADELRIKQILVNLLSNAVKFTPTGGTVTVQTDIARDNSAFIRITDTGIGMDEKDIVKAMEKFGQTERGDLMQAGEGTGLGLPLTKGLIDAHGGSLEISSKPNKGTVVTVHIPKERVLNKI